jgi:hypothetical protein
VTTAPAGQGFQRAGVTGPARPAAAAPASGGTPAAAPAEAPADANAANDGFLVNGSVNNGAASPFAQFAAFGNNRRRPGALYNAQFGVTASSSAWDAKNYSLTGQQTAVPNYNNLHFVGMFQGPLRIPRLLPNRGPNLFLGYQRTTDDKATTASQRMPTLLERNGDFSQTVDGLGRPITVTDPSTGQPFANNTIPRDRISPEAAALLGYYPRPTLSSNDRYNYQAPILSGIRQDSVQSRVTQVVNQRNQIFGTGSYARSTVNSTSLFRFVDQTQSANTDVAVNWNRRVSQFMQMRTRYQFTKQSTTVTPFFANRINVSGEAGITGNNQEPINWGPPSLSFSSVAGLSDGLPQQSDVMTHAGGAEIFLFRGRHNFTIGGDVRRHLIDIDSQQNPRGSFAFTGVATGHDLADFLLGTPTTASIAYGNADKYFRGFSYDAYITDDWRIGPSFTVTAGVRWEYEAPLTELQSRLVNLDVASDFSAAQQVLASNPTGPVTGETYASSLMQPDKGRHPAAARARVASDSRLVAGGARRVWRLSEHQRVSIDHDAARAAAAALDIVQHRQQRGESADAGQRIRGTRNWPRQHVRCRSELHHRRVAQLAGVSAARSAGVADRQRDVSRHARHEPHSGVPAEYVSNGRGESVSDVPGGIRVSDVERQLVASRGPAAASPPPA